ncbi:late embryogenesis abundant protein (LEA) family protein [Artemisia annua]|uniref:Late embryogenesis abundant protein (LEA) family protein n=1 Tax=Artemisia annua TaxID=35608 RepID=A0A2U1P4H2_ARTAN|nr:late embryogenesis abundant protein (LEA) family protein [Artemisia annua]
MEAMNFTRVSILDSKLANIPRFAAPLSFSQKASRVCFITSSSPQRKHAIQVTNSTKGDDAASYAKDVNENIKQNVTELTDKTSDVAGKAADSAGKLQDDIQAKANEFAGKTSDSANETQDKVKDLASGFNEGAKEAGQDLKKTIEDAAANVAGKAEEGQATRQSWLKRLVKRLTRRLQVPLMRQKGRQRRLRKQLVI